MVEKDEIQAGKKRVRELPICVKPQTKQSQYIQFSRQCNMP